MYRGSAELACLWIAVEGTPGIFPSGDREGLTRTTYQPGSTILVNVSRRAQGETIKAAVESIPDLHALAEFARQQLRKARTVNVSDIGTEEWNTIRAHAGM
ncbi:hypothetical protein WJX75_004341 [Coccomyxa subellipsoidea]|uniref:Uncharacterized protein n=1 Tax=Coccomyxa subellipsoidea TaxID=248742 RepID=A0ABR2YYV4_9CHLO